MAKRHRLGAGRRADAVVVIRVSSEQREAVERLASELDCTMSHAYRHLVDVGLASTSST